MHEGFGIPVLEAMAQGTPVVCSDIPVFREVAGDAARFVPVDDVAALADAIGSLLGDDAAREALVRARPRARPGLLLGTLRRTATIAVYREVADADSPPRNWRQQTPRYTRFD